MKKMTVLFILIVLTFTTVVGQDITKLVRIHEKDNWVYSTPEGFIGYSVNETFVNRFNKEVNLVLNNASTPQVPLVSWQDNSYTFSNASSEITEQVLGDFAIDMQFSNVNEYFSTRGNYWHGFDGSVTITVQFGGEVFKTNASGEIWVNNGGRGSQNLAIVTGEPQVEILNLEIYEDPSSDQYVRVGVMFLIVPSDPYSIIWQGSNVTVVSLTETLQRIEVAVRYKDNDSGNSYSYYKMLGDGSGVIPNTGSNLYVYAKEIGLPVEIQGNVSVVAGAGASVAQENIKKLVGYSIKESYLEYPNPTTKTSSEGTPFSLFAAMLAIMILCIKQRKKQA